MERFADAVQFPPRAWPTPLINSRYFEFLSPSITSELLLTQGETSNLELYGSIDGQMNSYARLSEDGKLVVTTKTRVEKPTFGGKVDVIGRAAVVLFDADREFIWSSRQIHEFQVSNKNVERTDTWSEEVERPVMERVKYMFVAHWYDTPDPDQAIVTELEGLTELLGGAGAYDVLFEEGIPPQYSPKLKRFLDGNR
jgi:hypothetical protein